MHSAGHERAQHDGRPPVGTRPGAPRASVNVSWLSHLQRVAAGPTRDGEGSVPAVVQRAGEPAAGPAAGGGQDIKDGQGAKEQGAKDLKAAEVVDQLSRSIEGGTALKKAKRNPFAPGTWWPEDWMVKGPARLRKTLDRRVMQGRVFNEQDLKDIEQLSRDNPKWLSDVGIGTYAEARKYADEGKFGDWLKLPAGKRVLTATLALNAHGPSNRPPGEETPISPDYTLGRFMRTRKGPGEDQDRPDLEEERNRQIRDTAVDTLHPAGIAPEHKYAGGVPKADAGPTEGKGKAKEKEGVPDYVAKDKRAREMLTRVLLLLQNGLKLYDEKAKAHVVDYEVDVVRALAHGGRVNVRIPALKSKEEPAYALPKFLGITKTAHAGDLETDVDKRDYATHRTSIGDNKEDGEPGKFKEKGGLFRAAVTNKLTAGAARPELWGQDISGGGLGSKDWNGDVVLPNGSYGHMLLVFHRPTTKRDGSLQIGIETVAPDAHSPVGYVHDFRSSEATANPESVLHGHKGDKVGAGKQSDNGRLVDLREMGASHASGDWSTFLNEIEKDWKAALDKTEDGSQERRDLYESLVGPRARQQ